MQKFTQQQIQEMYDALEEIHETLTTKTGNVGGIVNLGQDEIGWLVGIGKLLEKIRNSVD